MKNTKIELSRSTTDYGAGEYQPTGVYDTIGNILKAVDKAGDWFDYINEPEQITAADGLYSIAEELDIDTLEMETFDELETAITSALDQDELKERIEELYDETPSEEERFKNNDSWYTYDYENALKIDVLTSLLDREELMKEADEKYYSWADRLYDELLNDDFVTGNASGSYTLNSAKAARYLVGNHGLAQEAFSQFGYPEDPEKLLDPETVDVTIRCYLLNQVINEIVDKLEAGAENE